jgi:hypothetical protein
VQKKKAETIRGNNSKKNAETAFQIFVPQRSINTVMSVRGHFSTAGPDGPEPGRPARFLEFKPESQVTVSVMTQAGPGSMSAAAVTADHNTGVIYQGVWR